MLNSTLWKGYLEVAERVNVALETAGLDVTGWSIRIGQPIVASGQTRTGERWSLMVATRAGDAIPNYAIVDDDRVSTPNDADLDTVCRALYRAVVAA